MTVDGTGQVAGQILCSKSPAPGQMCNDTIPELRERAARRVGLDMHAQGLDLLMGEAGQHHLLKVRVTSFAMPHP